ncbi:MAG: DUF4957 domain-containing protein [Bacteroidales bacterium]|nr:DUF4957 domain-containing protein [Bacteroidales bacterium]
MITMKRIFSAIIAGLAFIAFGSVLSGCAEEMVDINDEIALGRCLTPTELSAKIVNGEFIEFSWTKSKGATEFVLELYSDETMSSLVETLVIPAEDLPYTADLEADMTYYARVKGVNGDGAIADSHWAVFDRPLQTYAIKSSLNPELVDRSASSITVKWTSDPEVDHIRVTPALNADEEYTRFDVGADAVAAAQVEVTGLKPSVNYTLAVHFKSAQRGTVSAWTRPSIDGATEVATSEALIQAIADKAAVIKVAYSETPYILGSVVLGGSVAIYGDATAQGAQPVIQGGLKIGADVKSIHLEAVTFDGAGLADYPHNLTFDAAAAVENITVVNCKLNNYLRGVLYENSKAPTVGSIKYDGVEVNNVGGDGGDCFDFRGKAVVNSIEFINSTLNTGARTWFRIDANTTLESIKLTHCTFNNLCFANNGNNNGIFNIRALNAAGAAPAFELTHNVFLNMNDANKRCCLIAKNSTSAFPSVISDNFFYNCYDRFFIPQKDGSSLSGDDLTKAAEEGRALILVNGSAELTADPCVDSVRDKLNVTSAEVIEANAGDPRWYAVYVEIPEDLTQEVTPTGKVWNLTDGQTFKKVADKDMVRDGIRFYVKNTPINFTKEGFEFTSEAAIGADGIPSDGAIGIKVNEPGSIIISVAEATGHSNITVSLDGKVSASVPAGAEYQKVTFANISGEQMIYIYGCHPATMTFLQWTSDIQVLDKVLATPVVKINKTTVNERAEDEITLTWDPIDYAASYNVTVDGKKKNVAETTYSFSTANYAVEEAGGDFAIQVTAVPAEDDYIRVESQPAELSFHVNDVPDEPGIKIVRYDLTFPEGGNAEEMYVCENNAGFYVHTTGGWVIDKNSQKFAVVGSTEYDQYSTRLKGSKTSDSKTMTITVPNDGVLYIAARSANSSATDRTMALMQNGAEILAPTVIKDEDKFTAGDVSAFPYTVVNVKAGEIQVVLNNGINFYGIRYDATEGSAAEKVDKVWDFSAPEWVDAMTGSGIAANTNDSNWNLEVNGLKVVSGGGSIKWNKSGETYYWQPGGKSDGTTRYFEFTTDVAGTVTVYSSNTGGSEDLSRMVTVKVGDADPESLPGGTPSGDAPTKNDFSVSAGTVKIYPTGNGLRFYKIEFHSL